MKLSLLLHEICPILEEQDVDIVGLSLDSRQVKPGDLFLACKGAYLDGREFILEAIDRGARAIVAEAGKEEAGTKAVPFFSIGNINQKISKIAQRFYGYPSQSLRVIGITGTNGKTSCSHFIAAALQQLNIPCGIVGTLGNGMLNKLKPSNLTTPDAITLQKIFSDLRTQSAKVAAMEVSSHSIDQGRIKDIEFEVGIFTNLTRDHLDYHGSMAAYGTAKRKLFDSHSLQYAVINADDPFGQEIIRPLMERKNVYAYSTAKSNWTLSSVPLVYVDQIHLTLSGIKAKVYTPWGKGKLQTALIGQFNLSNVLAVLTTLCLLKIPFEAALKALSHLTPVAGRMQAVGGGDNPLIIVDYAHTPDALEKTLIALRQHCKGKLYCVFGCGGDRDRGKRPLMAKVVEQYADQVIVTDDNPRTEDPAQIVADIQQGFDEPSKIIVQHDRSKAIHNVIQYATTGDCILIAGKGAETYQQMGTEKIPFSDVEKVREILDARLA